MCRSFIQQKRKQVLKIEEYVHFTTQQFVEHNLEPEPATVLSISP